VVVALEDDATRLPFVTENARFRRVAVPPFLVFVGHDAPLHARRRSDGTWDVPSRPGEGGWTATGLAYYPLWRAEQDGRTIATRRSRFGDLEIELGAGTAAPARLIYRAGLIEVVGSIMSAVAVIALGIDAWATRRRSASREVAGRADPHRHADRVGAVEDPRL